MNYYTHLEIAGSEYPIEIEYDYFGYKKGKRVKGEQIEPDESAFCEISGVKLDYSCDGEPSDFVAVELPSAVLEQLEEETLMENH